MISKMMRTIFTLISLCLLQTAFTQNRYDFFIVTTHSDSLDATCYIPTLTKPPNGYPAILFVHGFSLSKDYDTSNCSVYSKSGYVTMCYSVRGHGKSTGGSTIMSVKERSDLEEVFNFLKMMPEVDSTKIGLSGGSQGGLHGLWAIADDLPVCAVSSDVIVPHWASDMLVNGSVRRTVLLLLQHNLGVRFDPIRDTLWSYMREDNFDAFAEHFVKERDIDTSQLNSKTIPSLRLLKWQDHYFTAADGIQSFKDYGGIKKLYLGTRGHFSDVVNSERLYQSDIVTRWFNYFLRDQQNGILDEPIYTYAYSHLPMDSLGYFSWTRKQELAWPPPGIELRKFYLASDSMLLFSSTSHTDTFTLTNNYLSPAYTFDTAYIEGFKGPRFDILLPKQTLSFTSPVLREDVLWIGAPKMKLFVQSNNDKFPLHAQIYEVDSTDQKYFINRINFIARHWSPRTSNCIEVEGIEHAHKFSPGSRIRIELTNIDKTNRIMLGDSPFVVPMFAQASATIYAGESHPSYIELPLFGVLGSAEQLIDPVPTSYVTINNYPNPFNPATTIVYNIPKQSRVFIAVYNTLGQFVQALTDVNKVPGKYELKWDAGALPSGIYFCRITVKPLETSQIITSVRKLLLLR